MTTRYTLLVVEPSDIIKEGLAALLNEAFIVVPMLSDTAVLAKALAQSAPDVLLVNATLLTAQQVVELRQSYPKMAVVALVYQYVEPHLLQSYQAGLDIRESRYSLASTLKECVMNDTEENTQSNDLSERELEVLVLIAQGLSSKEIADRLNISIHTVNTHRKNLTRKTGIRSVAGLAVYAMLHNLV